MLAGWCAAPARFREDANAEDDLALGGYRDRLLVELAQNAADAAGSGGRLRLGLNDGVLTAANTGAPLTADGLQALATLRASAKRSGRTVGRFGVGFAAVAAVSDDVVVASRTGAVRFSRALTAAEVALRPELAEEVAARGGQVPLLRLPWPAADLPPDGFDTVVRVVLRPGVDGPALLAGFDPATLLVLPGLARVEVGDRSLVTEPDGDDVLLDGRRWRVIRGEGELDPALLAGRPVEERSQTRWTVTWAVPVDEDGRPEPVPGPAVVRAPTPTDDPLSLPALLAASLPLGPDRRRVVAGPLRDAVLAEAARLLAALMPRLADDPSRLVLVPGPLADGELDAALSRAVLGVLRESPVLAGGLRPAGAVVVDGLSDTAPLQDLLAGVLPAAWAGQRWRTALTLLGVRRLDLAALTEVLAGVDRPPAWWHRLYDVLPPDLDQLAGLPVPLADGRLAPAPRGLSVADGPVDLGPLGVRAVHPEAVHPLLLRLGAVPADPRTLLDDPRVRAAVEAAIDDEDPRPVVDAVLALVGGAALTPGELPWLSALPLPDADGEWTPAGDLLLPHGPLAQVVDIAAGFGTVADGVAPDDVLASVGVLRGFAAVGVDAADGVDGLDEWLASLAPGAEPGLVVRDLDLVRPDAWPAALDLLDQDGLLDLPYVRWLLARLPVLAGQRPAEMRLPGSDPLLTGLYDEARHPRAASLGAITSLAEVVARDPGGLLDRLADPDRRVGRDQLRAVYAALAAVDPEVEPPSRVRAVVDGRVAVVPAEDAVVVDRPDLLARVAPYAVVPVPLALVTALADVLDLALATELLTDARLPTDGATPWPAVPGLRTPIGRVVERSALRVPSAGGADIDVAWAVDGDVDQVVGVQGRARALAWRTGQWHRRAEIAARLSGDEPAEADLDPV